MSEIWNLSALCRCCHADGHFNSIYTPHNYNNKVEIYSAMLRETFDINMSPPTIEASCTICDECIRRLQEAFTFKQQVQDCERKFEEYCKNEQYFHEYPVEIKTETEFTDNDNHKREDEKSFETNIKEETKPAIEIKTEVQPNKNSTEAKTQKKPKNQKVTKKNQKLSKPKYDASLEKIIKTDTGTVYKCKSCSESFQLLKHLSSHIMNSHLKLIACKFCKKILKGSLLYKEHVQKYHDKPYRCKYCGKTFAIKSVMLDHTNVHTKKQKFVCKICNKIFWYNRSLLRHKKIHNGLNKIHICDVCGWRFNDVTNLRIHVSTVHEKQRPFACDLCEKTFTARKHIIEHLRKHTGERPYQCDACDATFFNATALKLHKQKHGVNYAYTCSICKESFDSRGKFRSHVNARHATKLHVCNICGKDFVSKYSLNRHILAHNGVKFSCSICQKSYAQKAKMMRHMSKHEEKDDKDKPKIPCSLCKRSVYDMEKHMKCHNNRKFNCNYCDRGYSEQNTLNRHIRVRHFGRRPHECDLCDKKYALPTGLKAHKLKVHKITHNVKTDSELDSVAKYSITKLDSTECIKKENEFII